MQHKRKKHEPTTLTMTVTGVLALEENPMYLVVTGFALVRVTEAAVLELEMFPAPRVRFPPAQLTQYEFVVSRPVFFRSVRPPARWVCLIVTQGGMTLTWKAPAAGPCLEDRIMLKLHQEFQQITLNTRLDCPPKGKPT